MKRVPTWSIRKRLAVLLALPLASLIALWAFAANGAVHDAGAVLKTTDASQKVGLPADKLVRALQDERLWSVAYLGGPTTEKRQELSSARAEVNRRAATFRRLATSSAGRDSVTNRTNRLTDRLISEVDKALTLRDRLDANQIDATEFGQRFSAAIGVGYQLYSSMGSIDDRQVQDHSNALVRFNWAREMLSREDALFSAVQPAGRFTPDQLRRFIQWVSLQRQIHADALSLLPASDNAAFERIERTPEYQALTAMEEQVIATGASAKPNLPSFQAWRAAMDKVQEALADLAVDSIKHLIKTATPVAVGVFVRLGIIGVLGLIAVVVSIVVSVRMASTLVRRLTTLRMAALELSTQRLPNIVERLQRGEDVDVRAESPPLAVGKDEIGQVGQAFNAAQHTAVATAVEQAKLRSGVSNVFMNIARRNQALVHRQIKLLDVMERRANDPEELDDLFRVDHLATRMRRNAENLVILGGATPGRRWRNPVPISEVLRGAAAEVDDYARVRVLPTPEAALTGSVVGDVVHLLAELIENATAFSPPHTDVHVRGQLVPKGFAVEIEDRGLGMTPEEFAEINRRLATSAEFSVLGLTDQTRLGMFVVSRLAARHDIKVSLRESPYGGTAAIVLLPLELIVQRRELAAGTSQGEDHPEDKRHHTDEIPSLPRILEAVKNVELVAANAREDDAARTPTAESPPGARSVTVEPLPRRTVPLPRAAEPPATNGNGHHAHEPTDGDTTNGTHLGLPRRVRQASLAPQLAAEPVTAVVTEPLPDRDPDDIRRMMSAYQRASAQGRTDGENAFGRADGSTHQTDTAPGRGATAGTPGEADEGGNNA